MTIPRWPLTPAPRIDPPHVTVEIRWEYQEVIREIADGIMSEAELNALGAQGWELMGLVSAGTGVHFYFKREQGP